MKTIKVSEATGPALDWLVAKCEGYKNLRKDVFSSELVMDPPRVEYGAVALSELNYSTDWAQGGQLIEREAHNLFKHNGGTDWCCACNVPRDGYTAIITADGPTPLIAAMRCVCCSKLGDVVDIPEELCPQQNS